MSYNATQARLLFNAVLKSEGLSPLHRAAEFDVDDDIVRVQVHGESVGYVTRIADCTGPSHRKTPSGDYTFTVKLRRSRLA